MSKENKSLTDTSMQNQDSTTLPYLYKVESDGSKIYLTEIDQVDKKREYIKNFLSYGYLNDSIGADDIFIEYTLRDEFISQTNKNNSITERSYISRYIPTEKNDYYVSTILTLINMIEPMGCKEIAPGWSEKSLLSKDKNKREQDMLNIFRLKKK